MRRRASDLPFVVEKRDGELWNPIARFETEHYARLFMEGMKQYDGSAFGLSYRLKNVNKVLA